MRPSAPAVRCTGPMRLRVVILSGKGHPHVLNENPRLVQLRRQGWVDIGCRHVGMSCSRPCDCKLGQEPGLRGEACLACTLYMVHCGELPATTSCVEVSLRCLPGRCIVGVSPHGASGLGPVLGPVCRRRFLTRHGCMQKGSTPLRAWPSEEHNTLCPYHADCLRDAVGCVPEESLPEIEHLGCVHGPCV